MSKKSFKLALKAESFQVTRPQCVYPEAICMVCYLFGQLNFLCFHVCILNLCLKIKETGEKKNIPNPTKSTQTKGNNSAFSFLLVDHSTSKNFCASSPTLNCTSLLLQEPCKTALVQKTLPFPSILAVYRARPTNSQKARARLQELCVA